MDQRQSGGGYGQSSGTSGNSGYGQSSSGGNGGFPVDNETYDLLQALTSKLEAIDAYRTYMRDGNDEQGMFQQMAQEDSQHAQQLLDALKQRLGS